MRQDQVERRRNRGGWSRRSLALLERVQAELDRLKKYWPLTLRQVYYRLVAAGTIANAQREYAKLSRLLVKARLDGHVPWEALEDRARSILPSGGWPDGHEFVADQLEEFLAGYRRDLLQSQEVVHEVWVEKDALSRIFHRTAFPYCVPVIVARGFSSVSYVHECRKRIERNAEQGKRTEILYFGDMDPSGWEMLPSMMETLQVEMRLEDLVVGNRCALTPELVEEYALPHDPSAFKVTDTRAKKYRERFGDLAVELDALPPDALGSLIEQAIESRLDMAEFSREMDREEAERREIACLKTDVQEFVEEREGREQ